MTGIFQQPAKRKSLSTHIRAFQFILINREWLIRRHSTGASITVRRHWAEHTLEISKIHLDKNLFSFQNEINPTAENPSGLLVPIVIGILLAVVVLLVVIFFIVKRRRSQSKYDPENAQNGEESKQLNPEVWVEQWADVRIVQILTEANAWIHSVQRQTEWAKGLDVTSQLSRRCCRVPQGLDTCDHGKCNWVNF